MRLWGSGRRRAAAGAALASYEQWRDECAAVRIAYLTWRGASAIEEARAFKAYRAALDREEGAAVRYANRIRRARQLTEAGLVFQLAHRQTGFGT
jgi:hypothetical protein